MLAPEFHFAKCPEQRTSALRQKPQLVSLQSSDVPMVNPPVGMANSEQIIGVWAPRDLAA
jgi:hypothetical protein